MIRRFSAAGGTLLLVLFLAAVYREATPEWKSYQHNFQRLEEQELRASFERASQALNRPESQGRRAELERQLSQLQEGFSQPENQRRFQEDRGLLGEREDRLERAQDRLQRLRADYQVLEHALSTAEEKRLPGLRRSMETLKAAIEQAAAARDDVKRQADLQRLRVQEHTAEINRVLEDLAGLTAEKDRLARDLARTRGRSPEIQQILLEELNTADRCGTCHLGVAQERFSGQPVPYGRHSGFYLQDHPVSRFGCASCHGGQPRATNRIAAHGQVPFWPQPLIPMAYLGGACGKCHRDEEIPFEPWLNDGRRLFAEAGCAGCHDVEGLRPKDKIGPDLSRIGDKVSPAWLERWLKNPKEYLPATRMPNFLLSGQEVASLRDFLLSLRSPVVRQTSPPSGNPHLLEAGKKLFSLARCISCHAVNGRGGTLAPDLGRVAGKVRPGWVPGFLGNPRTHWARTGMPRYRFRSRELQALAAYIASEFQDSDWPASQDRDADPAPLADPDLAAGKALIRKYGCYGCHDIPAFERYSKVGAELNSFADKEVERLDFGTVRSLPRNWYAWTRTKLRTPRVFREGLRMPSYAFTNEEAEALTVFLRSLSEENIPPGYRMPVKPASQYTPEGAFGRLADNLNCLVCHSIRGRGGTLAPDLSYEGSRVRPEWLREFLRNPNTIRLYLPERMPQFQLSVREVDEAVNYMKTVLVHEGIAEKVFAPGELTPRLAARGRRLYYEKYACQGCHQIGLSGGAVGPELTQVSRRLTQGWLLAWLKGSQKLVPGVKEPQYNLTDEEARAIAAFLLSLPASGGA